MITEFPLFLFTTLGGLAAGAYAVSAFFPKAREGVKRPWLFPFICIVLLGVGLLGVLGHLGRPERFLLALSNPSSMIAEEAYWSIALGVCMLIDVVFSARKGESPRVVHILGAVTALGLMCVMGWAYFTAYGNPAWAAWPTLPLFIVGDLAMGAALVGLLGAAVYRKLTFVVSLGVLGVLTALSMVAVAMTFAAHGHDMLPFAIGAVLILAGLLCGLLVWKEKLPAKTAPIIVFACLIGGVAISRYAFYAASIL